MAEDTIVEDLVKHRHRNVFKGALSWVDEASWFLVDDIC